jgi:ABC-2 type transport system ATP-binding protein
VSEPVIDTHSLGKSFDVRTKAGRLRRTTRTVIAVTDVNLQVEAGEMVGFIGPNGAGKSTTIKMLTGVLAPSSGEARVLGYVPLDERTKLAQRIGVVFGQRSQLWWDLPLGDSFSLLRHIYRVPADRFDQTLRWLSGLFDLGPLLPVPVRQLSLGQRMRGELAAALLHEPELLFLDEPTIGLDVVSKHAVREALSVLNRERGTTVLLTTHDLADIEQLCERVVIIDHGRVIEDGPLATLLDQFGSERTLVVELMHDGEPLQIDGVVCDKVEGRRQWLRFRRADITAAAVLTRVTDLVEVRDFALEEPEIEQIVRRIYLDGPEPS